MTEATGLRGLLAKATPGPWEPICDHDDEERAWVLAVTHGARTYVVQPPSLHDMGMLDADASLIALAPDMARLLVDMADVLDEYDAQCECGTCTKNAALLARFAEIERRAAR